MAKASEFGGVEGRIQPLPHALTPAEASRLERAISPTDEAGTVDGQRVVDAGKRGVGPVDRSGNL